MVFVSFVVCLITYFIYVVEASTCFSSRLCQAYTLFLCLCSQREHCDHLIWGKESWLPSFFVISYYLERISLSIFLFLLVPLEGYGLCLWPSLSISFVIVCAFVHLIESLTSVRLKSIL